MERATDRGRIVLLVAEHDVLIMPIWATILIAAIAAIPGSLLGYAALIRAKDNHKILVGVAHGINGILEARVNVAEAVGKVREQNAQALRDDRDDRHDREDREERENGGNGQ